jgi:pimeloyl-ACP methyl ester carboxylesterase
MTDELLLTVPDNYKNNQIDDFIIVNGKRIEAAWYGPLPEDAPTLVFLHQGLGCAALWHDYPKKLAAATKCSALVYSRFGYGKSDPCSLPRPVRFMHDEGLTVLPELLKVTGVQDFILVGHSDGGSIALIYAGGIEANSLRGVITEAAHVFFEEMTMSAQQKAKESYERGDLRRKLIRFHADNTDCAFRGWNDVWMSPEFATWDIQEYLPQIKVPMLVILNNRLAQRQMC